jgi:hypothetical protein
MSLPHPRERIKMLGKDRKMNRRHLGVRNDTSTRELGDSSSLRTSFGTTLFEAFSHV